MLDVSGNLSRGESCGRGIPVVRVRVRHDDDIGVDQVREWNDKIDQRIATRTRGARLRALRPEQGIDEDADAADREQEGGITHLGDLRPGTVSRVGAGDPRHERRSEPAVVGDLLGGES